MVSRKDRGEHSRYLAQLVEVETGEPDGAV